MNKKAVWISVVAAVAVVLVAGTVLFGPKKPGAQSATGTGSIAAAKKAATNAGTGGGQGSAGKGQPNGAARRAPLQKGPTVLVTDPKKSLQQITKPPSETLAMLNPSVATSGTEFKIEFVPYGYGPGGPGQSIAAKLQVVTLVKGTKPKIDLTGHNILLDISGIAQKTPITAGGTYTGTLVLKGRGSVLVPTLTNVSAKKG